MSSVDKLIEMFILLFISYQGILLLVSPSTRNRLYQTVDAINQVGLPDLEYFVEHGRLLLAVALIPTCLYPRSWLLPKFISLISYVIYICIIYNLYLFNTVQNLAQFLFQMLILFKVLLFIVDDLILLEIEQKRNLSQNSKKNTLTVISAQPKQTNVNANQKLVEEGSAKQNKK